MIKMVIFDLDNTLYDYDYCNQIAEKKLLSEVSKRFEIPYAEAAKLLNNAKKHVKKQLGNVAASHNRILYMQDICEQISVNPLLHVMDFYNLYWDTLLEKMQLYPYVRPLLDLLKKRNIMAGIITDLTAHIQYRKLDKLQLLSDIDFLTTSEEAGQEKPSEAIFRKMISKAGFKPTELLMIGDSKMKDIDGALALGIHTILFCPEINIINEVEAFL